MKKVLLAAIAISIGFAACKKDNAEPEKIKIEKKTLDGEDGGDESKDGSGNNGGWGG